MKLGCSILVLSVILQRLWFVTSESRTCQCAVISVELRVSRCFAVLRQLRTIRRQAPTAVFQSLIIAPVLLHLDYCNNAFYGFFYVSPIFICTITYAFVMSIDITYFLTTSLIRRLQSVR